MKALFVTTTSNEMYVVAQAWLDYMGPMGHITFPCQGPPNDEAILSCARGFRPDVIIYSGGNSGEGLPTIETLLRLREIAPSVHYQGDLEDVSWWATLRKYEEAGCFSMIVNQTGVEVPHVNWVTLTAISPKPFERHLTALMPNAARIRRCGFSGNFQDFGYFSMLQQKHPGFEDPRSAILHQLHENVKTRPRETSTSASYHDYAGFLCTSDIALNTSFTGSGEKHHVKGRVVEAAWAKCALLEYVDSPTKDWFPPDTFYTYSSVPEAKDIIQGTTWKQNREKAEAFSSYAYAHYTPDKIYGEMVARLGL